APELPNDLSDDSNNGTRITHGFSTTLTKSSELPKDLNDDSNNGTRITRRHHNHMT
ncbi:34258_t:CDS:1, partial [Racocetra persica]